MDKQPSSTKPEITLSEEALSQAISIREETDGFQGKPLRLYIEGKGCDGFYYGVTFDDPQQGDERLILNEELDLIVDQETLKFCQGSVINWVDDDRGKGFLVENPNHRKFRGKFYKRKNWQERLLTE